MFSANKDSVHNGTTPKYKTNLTSMTTTTSPPPPANNNNNSNASASPEQTIKLNNFLDFLNLSFHVNDMISQTGGIEPQKESQATITGRSNVTGTKRKTQCTFQNPIEFQLLAHNHLVNELFSYKRSTRNNTNTDDSSETAVINRNVDGNRSGTYGYLSNSTESSNTSLSRTLPSTETTAARTETNYNGSLHPKLNEKLDYILNEGILDAAIPFICPVPLPSNYNKRLRLKVKNVSPNASTTTCNTTETESEHPNGSISKESNAKSNTKSTKSLTSLNNKMLDVNAPKKESEVVIHVCDEVKNTSKDFVCPQNLLVSKMGYFADVTAGKKLEDMDISVHCDIQIFDWLMKWVKSNGNHSLEQVDGALNLNVSNVVPILVSASFLQMETLLLDCLSFCHSSLGEVVKASTHLSCLNDSIITRMAAMFTNVELEMVCDKKDRLMPRLWTKLIQSLCEPEPEALRGHFYSLAGLFRCAKCNQCLTNTMKSYIPCIQGNVRLNRWGQLISHHVKDNTWDLNIYITQLFKEFKSWRRVYWKLWGHAHYLYCYLCEMYFPVYQMSWCRYHPEPPSFLGPVTEGGTTGPAGRYACCGQQTFRYETLPAPNGCQFREHSVLVETDRERSILSIVQLATEGYALTDSPPQKLQDILTNGEVEPRWLVLSVMPQRCRQGLLPVLNPDEYYVRVARPVRPTSSKFFADSSTETESTDNTLENIRINSCKFGVGDYDSSFSSSSSDGCESSGSKAMATKKNYKKMRARERLTPNNPGRYWSGELSARSNQDHQREYEEKVMKQVTDIVLKKTGTDTNVNKQNRPMGGIYFRLEQEWKEQMKQRNYAMGASITSLQVSASNRNPNSNSTMFSIKTPRKKLDNGGGQ